MPRTWVLDTETKGTGATMVPLERRRKYKRSAKGISVGRPGRVGSRLRQAPEPAAAPEPRRARQFKLISAISCRVLAEGIGVRETIDMLERARNLVDVRVYVREDDADEWRALTLAATRLLRGRPR